jgi:hypothetical protein
MRLIMHVVLNPQMLFFFASPDLHAYFCGCKRTLPQLSSFEFTHWTFERTLSLFLLSPYHLDSLTFITTLNLPQMAHKTDSHSVLAVFHTVSTDNRSLLTVVHNCSPHQVLLQSFSCLVNGALSSCQWVQHCAKFTPG